MSRAFVGTSGWSYDSWRDDFYAGVPRSRWLEHCASSFTALEINATFYHRQRRETLARWAASVPESFVFALKAHRYVTHSKLLLDPVEPVRRERDRAAVLGSRLGAVLWQVPKRLAADPLRLARFAHALRSEWPARHAIELRSRDWFTEDVAALMTDHGIANCISDAADWPMWEVVTADFVYVRLHGHARTYASSYAPASLRSWAARIEEWMDAGLDVHVYFDNDALGRAPVDAARLLRLLGEPADRAP